MELLSVRGSVGAVEGTQPPHTENLEKKKNKNKNKITRTAAQKQISPLILIAGVLQ